MVTKSTQINPALEALPPYPFAKLAAIRRKLQSEGVKILDFTKGDPIEPTAAFIREALAKAVPAVSQYPAVKGTPELRTAIAGYVARTFQVTLDPETEIIQSNGSKEAIYNLAQVVVGPSSPKRTIIATVPGYMVPERSASLLGLDYYPLQLSPENNFLPELSDLSPGILERTAMVWLNYPNNPTGAVCDRSYFERQVKVARDYGILLCSDECYVDMYLDGTPHPSVLQVTTEGVLAFFSCSKRSGMTGYRTGFIAGDKDLLARYLSARDAMGVETSVMVQAAAAAAWSDDAHVEERREVFRQKRTVMAGLFKELGIEFLDSPATFYLWVKAPQGMTGETYAALLLKEGVMITPGYMFGGSSEAWARVALVPSVTECEEAAERWRSAHRALGL